MLLCEGLQHGLNQRRDTPRGGGGVIPTYFVVFPLGDARYCHHTPLVISRPFISLWHHLRYVPLLSALTFSRLRGFDARGRALGKLIGFGTRWLPHARGRMDREILQVFPDLPRAERIELCRKMGRKMGRTLFEVYHCAEFQTHHANFSVTGPGLAVLEDAHAKGRGAIIVSGHFGQWEAIRAVLRARGMETGAVYRPQNNRHYQRRLLAGIEAGGMPILATGPIGTKALVQHVRSGGFIAILLDVNVTDGAQLPFLGHNAPTSLTAARLALKYDLPMVPAYGTRVGESGAISVDFESAIPHSDAETMTRAFNDSLSARILDKPDQWYWMLRRWHGKHGRS